MRRFLAGLGASLVLGCTAACEPPADASRVLLDETFVHAWPDDQRGCAWFTDAGYRLSARQPGEFVAVRAPLADVPPDVIVSGTFRKLGGPPGGGYGLILADQRISAGDGKDQSGQFIVAAVGDRGEVGIWRRDGERWMDLLSWTSTPAVHAGTNTNDLTVQLAGGRLTFFVNGQQVADLANLDTAGVRGSGVGIFTGGDLNEVVVNRFRVEARGRPVNASPAQRPDPTPAPPRNTPPALTVPPSDPQQRVPELLAGIADDIGAIAQSFSGGLDNPHDPVTDPIMLKQDAARLAAATSKANELLAEMERLRNGAPGGR